jgi:prevent-host-death family protein
MKEAGLMEATKINATELRIQTRDILERARFKGERFMIQTFGKQMAVIMGIEEYKTLTRAAKQARKISNSSKTPRKRQR